MAITKLDLKLTNINVTDTIVDSINVEISPNDEAPISNNEGYTVIVKKLNGISLEEISDANLENNGKTITFGSSSALSYRDLILVIVKNIAEDFLSNRLIVDFYQQFNSNSASYAYFPPAPGKYQLKVDYLGDFSVPEGDKNIGATICVADINHITGAKIYVEKPHLVKISSRPINVSLQLAGSIEDSDFGYEVVFKEEKT